nr:hypothetical protein [Tanacetum cinerariifolium]
DSDLDVVKDLRSSSEFIADLNVEYHERALLANQKSDDENEEPTPQPKPQPTKPIKETPIPKPYKLKILYPQRLRKEKMEAQYGKFLDVIHVVRIYVPLVNILAGIPNYVMQKQRRLNPNMQEVVKKEIMELMDTGIIYPIADSLWVSPINCVPKKDAHLVLNWEKYHFMVKEGIALGHKVSSAGLEVDKAKINIISELPPPANIKEIKERKGTEKDETSDDSEVDDNFPGETLMRIDSKNEPRFADFANYLAGDIIPKMMTYQQKNKFFSDLKYYFWEEHYLFKYKTYADSLEDISRSKEAKLKCLRILEIKIQEKNKASR